MTKICRPPNPNPTPPAFVAPEGTTDCHLHIFGPQARYPYVPHRSYTPPDAETHAYRHLADTIGIGRAVVVQASVYGFDNRRTLDAMDALDMSTRAVLVVPPTISDSELDDHHRRGARGVRIIATHPGGLALDDLPAFAGRLADRDWHIQFMLSPSQLVDLAPNLRSLPCSFVIDHFAGIPAEMGVEQPAFQTLLRLMEAQTGWAKLSAAYHCSKSPPPYRDLGPMAQALVGVAPDRLVWGSDWPHVHFDGPMPNTTSLFDRLEDWLPDAALRRQVLVENPARLYGF